MGDAARVCMRKARVLCGETDTQTGRVVLRVSEGEIGVRRGWQTTGTRRKTTRAARAKIGPSRFSELCADSHAVAVAAAEQTCVYGQGGCEARSDARSGNKRANVLDQNPQGALKIGLAEGGPEWAFRGAKRVAFSILGEQLFPWSRFLVLRRPRRGRFDLREGEVQVAASLAGCDAFELNRL